MTSHTANGRSEALKWLAEFSRKHFAGPFNAAVLGSGWGAEASLLAMRAGAFVWAVDDYGKQACRIPAKAETIYSLLDERFGEHVEEAAKATLAFRRGQVRPLEGIPRLSYLTSLNKTFDLIYANYDRSEEGMLEDCLAWRQGLRQNGVLCGYGYGAYYRGGGVSEAARRLAEAFECELNVHKSVWWMRPVK